MHKRISVNTLSEFPGLGYKNARISRTLFAMFMILDFFQTGLFEPSVNDGCNTGTIIICIQFRKYSMSH